MYQKPDAAWKFGCGRYIQRQGAWLDLTSELNRLGARGLILTGQHSWHAVEQCYPHEDIIRNCMKIVHKNPCNDEDARLYAAFAHEHQLNVIIGVGGGRIMDTAKIVGDIAGKPVINVPTISATCAAFTPLSVMYSKSGQALGSFFFENEVSCLLVDSLIMERQPARYLFSGIVDSLAKAIEIRHTTLHLSESADMAVARINAEYIFDRLSQLAFLLPDVLKSGSDTAVMDEAVFLIIAATGFVSGCARGQGQSAFAHGFYESMRTLFTAEAAAYLHGEIVGIGLRLQTLYDEKPVSRLDDLLGRMKMPLHLRDIHVPENRQVYIRIAENMAKMLFWNQEYDTVDRTVEALIKME